MRQVSAVILGGGRGTRLAPLTLPRAKPAVGVAGKYRLIDIPISNCINSGIKRIFVVTQFLSTSLHRHIMQTYQFDVFSDGFVEILAAERSPSRDDWLQGTADAVRAKLHNIEHYPADQYVILAGDHLYRMDYGALVRHHRERGADITIAVSPVLQDEATRMGLMRVDGDGWVEEYVEKPSDPSIQARMRAPRSLFPEVGDDRFLASMGVYVFEASALRDLLSDTTRLDFGGDVLPAAIGTRRVSVYPFDGYWRDIGTIGAFFEANVEMTSADPPYPLYAPNWPIFTHERSLPPSRVMGSEIRDSLLVEGSDVRDARLEHSILGVRSAVRAGSQLREVIVLGADYYEGEEVLGGPAALPADAPPLGIGRDCRIERAIIDKNARIGDGVIIRSQKGQPDRQTDHYWVRDGVTVIPSHAIIPPGTLI